MSEHIHIGSVKVALLDYAVSCTAILGIRDSGKTVTAKGIAEQLLEHDVPIVVFDAVGKWRWMKVPGAGKNAKGYKVVVAGGRAPDLALTPHSVAEIVRSAVKEKIPLIIDLYDPKLSKADWRRIVQQSIRIIHYEANGVAHVFLEEAAEFIPQKVMDGETYAEVEKLARMGGNASVGITLINQRSQEVNKAVLDLAHNLVLGCQIGNKAIEAVEKWVDRLAPETAKAVTMSLPHLKSGEAWIWTRSNPSDPIREQLPMCRSLHPDRRTPDVVLKSAKATDTDEFVKRLSDSIPKVIEEAKANDPAELKRTISVLRREITSLQQSKPATETKIKHEAALTDAERTRLTKLIESFDRLYNRHDQGFNELHSVGMAINEMKPEVGFFKTLLTGKLSAPPLPLTRPQATSSSVTPVNRVPARRTVVLPNSHNGSLPYGEEKILSACIQFPEGLKREQLTVLTTFKRSTRDAYIYRLMTKGYVTANGDAIIATPEGVTALPNHEPLPTGEELQEHWRQQLPSGEQQLFEHIVAAYPNSVSRDQLTEATGFKRSTRDAYLYRMSSKMLFSDSGRGEVRASDNLFQ